MKGIAEIVLTDVNTGKVTKHVEENMFTNALNDIFNRAPWYSNSNKLGLVMNNNVNPLVPVVKNALGGILVFPQTIDEDSNILFAPADNKLTGMASVETYSGDDGRRGNFNAIESGEVTNGYRFVFDFSTSQSNGVISCLALTSKRGADGYWDGSVNLLQDKYFNNEHAAGTVRGIGNGYMVFGADDTGVYLFKPTNKNIYKIKVPKRKLSLMSDMSKNEQIGTVDSNGIHVLKDNKIWIVRNNTSSGNTTLTIEKYSLADWSKTVDTITVAAPLYASGNDSYTSVVGDYIYLLGNNRTSIYKINLANIADVTEIPNAYSSAQTSVFFAEFNGGVISRYCLIEADNTVHSFNLGCHVAVVEGTWAITNSTYINDGYGATMGATTITPYLATINNLENAPITKTASQTMKITYTVYEE